MKTREPEQIATDDAIVLMFISLVEEDGIEVPVTLNINGMVISGLLIGASAYYEGVTESSKLLHDGTMSKIIFKKMEDLKEAYVKQKQEDEEQGNQENPPTFIHLKNAIYFTTDGQSNPTSNTWWRGRISSIDGFSLDFLV